MYSLFAALWLCLVFCALFRLLLELLVFRLHLHQLQTLGLFGNPQKTIRQALIHKGTDAILLVRRGNQSE